MYLEAAAHQSTPRTHLWPSAGNLPGRAHHLADDLEMDVGSIIAGRYELVDRLGGGGMGEVFKAVDQLALSQDDPDPYVAIKILKPELQQDRTAVKALQREANRALRLTHANIVRVRQLEQDRETGTYFIVMELLEGRTVQTDIASHSGGRPWREISSYVAQICAGLDHAHREGIIHCDIKPGNLFITRRGLVKILDFGIAAPVPTRVRGDRETWVSRKLGARTPEYASLEMFLGHEAHYSDDVYSLACVVHEWLTGTHPYIEKKNPHSPVAAPEALASGLAPARAPGLTRAQQRALHQGLALSRTERTGTVAELWRALSPPRHSASAGRVAAGAGSVLLAGGLLVAGLAGGRTSGPLPLLMAAANAAQSALMPAPLDMTSVVTAGTPARGELSREVSPVPGPALSAAPAFRDAAPSPRPRQAREAPQPQHSAAARPQPEAAPEPAPVSGTAHGEIERTEADADEVRPTSAGWLMKEAQEGNALAQCSLGLMYESGQGGLPHNDEAAAAWFERAARQGNLVAQYELGVLYQEGRGGLPRNEALAAGWFEAAAARGSARAQLMLGLLYQAGRGVPHSDTEAVRWLTRAADQGDADAQARLGLL